MASGYQRERWLWSQDPHSGPCSAKTNCEHRGGSLGLSFPIEKVRGLASRISKGLFSSSILINGIYT